MSLRREGQVRMAVSFGPREWDHTGRLQWYAARRVPSLVAKAAQAHGYSSSAHYIRTAILRALERDLGIDFEEMQREQPSKANNPLYKNPERYGASGTPESVR